MVIPEKDIYDFIPQRPPFIMVDNLLEATENLFKTDFRILPDNIFVENGILREFALIENIAQSSSAGLAVTQGFAGKNKPEGYLGAVSRLKLYELPKANETICTTVKLVAKLKNMYLLRGVSYVNEKKLIECDLKVVSIERA